MKTLKQLGAWARSSKVVVRISYAVRKGKFVVMATHWKTDLVKIEHEDVEEAIKLMVAQMETELPHHLRVQARDRKLGIGRFKKNP